VVNFTARRYTPAVTTGKNPGINRIGGSIGPIAGLTEFEHRKIQAVVQSLYLLSYTDSPVGFLSKIDQYKSLQISENDFVEPRIFAQILYRLLTSMTFQQNSLIFPLNMFNKQYRMGYGGVE